MDRSTLKQELEKVIGDSIETMNSKVQDGEENFEGDKNDIFPVALMRQEERARQRKMKIFLNGVGVAEIVMGVLALILNTIFIYDGMNSGWYSDQQEEGNGMKVISIGEGILAGVFCVDMQDWLFVNLNISRSFLHPVVRCHPGFVGKVWEQEGDAVNTHLDDPSQLRPDRCQRLPARADPPVRRELRPEGDELTNLSN